MKRILSLLVMACLLAFTGACSSKKAPEPEKPHYNPSLAFGATWTRHPVILNGDTQDVLEVVVSSANPGPVVVTGIDINGRPIAAAMPRSMEKGQVIPFLLPRDTQIQEIVVHTTDGDLETTQSPQALLAGDVADEFIRCHQSFWVNSRAIVGMEHETFCLSDGTRVPISRSYRKDAREALFRQLSGRTARLDVPEGAADGV